MGGGEEIEGFGDLGGVVGTAEGDHAGLHGGEDFVVQDAAGALIDELGLGEAFALEAHEAAGHFDAGLGVDEPFAADAGDFDLFLGVEAAISFFP